MGSCLGANNIPGSIHQYKLWIQSVLPEGKSLHYFGFDAICWAIWTWRNKAVFDGKLIRRHAEIIVHACAFMSYWAGRTLQHRAREPGGGWSRDDARVCIQLDKTPVIKMLSAPQELMMEMTRKEEWCKVV